MTSVVIRKPGRRRKPLTSPFNPFLRAILSCTYSACSWPPIDHSSLARNKSPTMNINIVASGSADDNVDSRSRTKGGTQLRWMSRNLIWNNGEKKQRPIFSNAASILI